MNASDRGANIKEFYDLKEEIGKGSFSVVRKGIHKKTGKEYAIKCIQKRFIKLDLLEREILIMKKLKHPHIIPLIEVFEDKEQIFLVLEMVKGGELFDKIVERGNYTEQDASNIVKQILEAVQYLHSHGVVHRDLKPENLLCSEDEKGTIHIYVSDFGLSRNIQANQSMHTYCGSPEYVAPEVLAYVPYGKEIDCWSIGVITYILLTGFLPFYDKDHNILFEKIQNVDYNWDDCPDVSPTAKHFIQRLLVKDPVNRYSVDNSLAHPWIKGDKVSKSNMPASFKEHFKEQVTKYNNHRRTKSTSND